MFRLLWSLLLLSCSDHQCQEWTKTDWKPPAVESGCVGVIARHGGSIITDENGCPKEQSCMLTDPESWERNGYGYYRTSDGPSEPTTVLIPNCVASSCEDLDLLLLETKSKENY